MSITKGITLKGNTTVSVDNRTANDQTIILVGTGGTVDQPLISVSVTNVGQVARITGITFSADPLRGTRTNYPGMIQLIGSSMVPSVRLDNCHIGPVNYELVRIYVLGAFGVIDHNLFSGTDAGFSIKFENPHWHGDTGKWGDKSWAEPAGYGGPNFIFVEDNAFVNSTTQFRGVSDTHNGARFVFRYNHIYNYGYGNHGTEIGRYRGSRCFEVYNNDYHWTFPGANAMGGTRSGSFLWHDNTYDGTYQPKPATLTQYRLFINSNDVFYGSTGENPWDYNVTGPDGTHVDGHPPYLFESGTAQKGSNQTTIVDKTKNWNTNQWVGYTAKKPGGSNPGIMLITSNTSTVLTGIYHTGFNRGVTWQAGDPYEIHRVMVSMDQPCRGAGDLLTGNPPINTVTGTASWPHQVLEPCYSWNNIYTPNNTHVNISPTTSGFAESRDFFNNTPMPGYTPYTYPHPLTTSLPPPQPRASVARGSHHFYKKEKNEAKKARRKKWGHAKENLATEMTQPDQ